MFFFLFIASYLKSPVVLINGILHCHRDEKFSLLQCFKWAKDLVN